MQNEIKSRDGIVIFEGKYESVKDAVCDAVKRKISLSGADLSYANLRGADLRWAALRGTDLRDADLRWTDLRDADLRGADLRGANLRDADLRGADLRGADLRGADIDYSCWPLYCGSLDVKIDKRQFVQLLYHTVRAGKSVDDDEVKEFLELDAVKKLANQFHRVNECGKVF